MLIALFIFRKKRGIIVTAIIATVINDAGEDDGNRINTGVRISSAACITAQILRAVRLSVRRSLRYRSTVHSSTNSTTASKARRGIVRYVSILKADGVNISCHISRKLAVKLPPIHHII